MNLKLEIERGQAEEVQGRERETEKVLKLVLVPFKNTNASMKNDCQAQIQCRSAQYDSHTTGHTIIVS